MDRLYDLEDQATQESGKASQENLEVARLIANYGYTKDTFVDAGKYDKAKEFLSGQFMKTDLNKKHEEEIKQKLIDEQGMDDKLAAEEARRQIKASADKQAEYTMQKIGTVKGVYKNKPRRPTNTENDPRPRRRGRRGNNNS